MASCSGLCEFYYYAWVRARWLMRTAVDVEVLRAGVADGGEERDEEQVDC